MYSRTTRNVFIALASLLVLLLITYHGKEAKLLLRRMGKEPHRVGAIMPSSKVTASVMVRAALQAFSIDNDFIVELGPGTGVITHELLAQGVAPEKLVCVELDPTLHKHMTEQFPALQIILGDAAQLQNILADKCAKVGAIVSAIPMANLSVEKREEILQACFAVLKPQGKIVQFTYQFKPITTIPGLRREFVKFVLWNMPPAFIWSLTKEEKQTNF